jgi:CubicO group peptidase (beta-lactamase class C family)
MMTFGWTVGELVRRVSGRSLGTFFQDEIAGPLGLDFWIGLPEQIEPRVAPIRPFVPSGAPTLNEFAVALTTDPASISALSLLNTGGFALTGHSSREAHAAELGGGGGITNARGLAGMYAPLAGGGGTLVSTDDVIRMSQTSMATQQDATLLIPTRFGLGFMKSMDNRHRPTGHIETMLIGDRAFGHAGAGGSLGFADPDCGLAFGYSMNQMGAGILLNSRGQSLVDAAYRCLGYRTNAPGVWTR